MTAVADEEKRSPFSPLPIEDDIVEETHEQLVAVGPAFHLDAHALVLNQAQTPTIEQYQTAFENLGRVKSAIRYWRGDLIRLVEDAFGEEAAQIVDAGPHADEGDTNAERTVSKQVKLHTRRLAPSWEHARAVAHLSERAQTKYLQMALDQDWIVSKLKTEILKDQADGTTNLRFLLIVDCGTEAKQEKAAKELETQGFKVTKRSSIAKAAKAKKIKPAKKVVRVKKGPVTAQKRRGAPKMYTRRRTPR